MHMRDFIAVVEEARANVQDSEVAELETAVQTIADYIQHNQSADFIKAATILDRYGYQEPVKQTTFYRALFHTITKVERETCKTIQEVFDQYTERGGGFNLGGVQGCAATTEGVYAFTYRCWHTSRNDAQSHYPDTPITEKLHDIAIVYEIEVPLSSILMSMRGLQAFLRRLPTSPAKRALDTAMNDIYEGYSGDDEVLIDTDSARIVGMTLWNSKKGESW